MMISREGMSIRFHETDVRETGRVSMGVVGMRFGKADDEVIGMQNICKDEERRLLVISEYGIGKRTEVSEFRVQGRGGQGILCYKITEKTGKLIGAKLCADDEDILIVTNEGVIMRTAVDSVSVIGRNTSGVKIMNIDAESGVKVAGIARAKRAEDAENSEALSEDTENEEE